MDGTYELELEFNDYLMIAGLDESTMPAQQAQEMRRCFYAGLGRMHRLCEKIAKENSPQAAEKILNDLEDQINIFWAEQVRDGNV